MSRKRNIQTPAGEQPLGGILKEMLGFVASKYGKEALPAVFSAWMNLSSEYQAALDEKEKVKSIKLSQAYHAPASMREMEFSLKLMNGLAKNNREVMMRNPMKPLYIPKSKRQPGLVVFCTHPQCNTNMTETCKETGKSLKSCPYGERHRFKVYVQVPGTTKRVTKTFETRSLQEAIKEAEKFRKSVREGKGKQQEEQTAVPAEQPTSSKLPGNILPLQSRYLAFTSGDPSVPLHLRRERSKPYVSEIVYCFHLLNNLLQREGFKPDAMSVSDIDKHIVGKFFEHLQNEKKYSNRSVNKCISFMRTFFRWVTKHEGLQVINPFELVIKLPEIHHPQAITKDEFDALINAIIPENGILRDGGVKKQRSMYFPWLKDAYRLSLYTGRRREEIINFRWSDIIKDKEGKPNLIQSEDRKVNAIMCRNGEGKKVNYVPVTAELHQLLHEMGYQQFKETPEFILAPEISLKRNKSMADAMSRSFSHFFKKTNPTRELKFKSIRKAYLTSMQIRTGDAKIVSGHSGSGILHEHYLDKAIIAQSLRNFSVFGSIETERIEELSRARKQGKNNEVSLEK